jgi:ABC-type sugar transport system substrate-binding protein
MMPSKGCENTSHRTAALSLVVFAFFITSALSVAGCGRPSQEGGKPKVAGIVFQEDQFFRLVQYGMQAAADEHGVELLLANSSNSLDKEISLIDTYIVSQVDAIVVSPLSMKSSTPALKRAHDSGITIVTYNTAIGDDFAASFIESDQIDLGAATGRAVRRYIEEELGGTAKLAMIECKACTPEQCGMRSDGFVEGLGDLEGVDIVAKQDAWLAPQAADVVESILTAHPDLDVIWASNEGGTVGAVTAVRNSGKAGQVMVFGTDMSEQLGDFLLADENILQAVTGQKPFEIGYMALEAAVKVLNDQPVEKKVSLPGVLFARERPDEVEAYVKRLEELTG